VSRAPHHTRKLFLSYASVDKRQVLRLASDLRQAGVAVWLDDWEIRAGDSIAQKIETGLRNPAATGSGTSRKASLPGAALSAMSARMREPSNWRSAQTMLLLGRPRSALGDSNWR